MGKRYRREFSQIKDNITYHVYQNGDFVKSFTDKEAAESFTNELEGTVFIKKTRRQARHGTDR